MKVQLEKPLILGFNLTHQLMRKYLSLALFASLAFACSPQEKEETIDYTQLSDEERLEVATKMAQETIIVDGHVDLPYRMKVGGFTLQREILDVSVRTPDGNFDFPRA